MANKKISAGNAGAIGELHLNRIPQAKLALVSFSPELKNDFGRRREQFHILGRRHQRHQKEHSGEQSDLSEFAIYSTRK